MSDDRFARLAGGAGLFGCVAAVVANVVGVAVNPHVSFVADTISDLAAGRHAWIQDAGLYAFAFGLALVGLALRGRRSGAGWQTGCVLLPLLAVVIFVIGFYGEYGNREPGGPVIHIYLVYAVGLLFAAATFLMAPGFKRLNDGWFGFDMTIAVLWTVGAPLLFLVPTAWDGLYERIVGGLMLIWVGALSVALIRGRLQND